MPSPPTKRSETAVAARLGVRAPVQTIGLAAVLLLVCTVTLHALNPSDWRSRQSFEIDAAGPLKIAVPTEILDRARSDFSDLRIVGPDGAELPYALLRTSVEPPALREPRSFRVTLENDSTVVTVRTGTARPLDSIELVTATTTFMKPARVEVSFDGRTWEIVAEGVPFFRQDGAEQTVLGLEGHSADWIRVTLGGTPGQPVAITGARLREGETATAPVQSHPGRIVSTEEFAGETVLTLDLEAANLMVAALELSATEQAFARRVTVSIRDFHNDEITERPLAKGTIHRLAFDASGSSTRAPAPVLQLEQFIPVREVVLRIENGDSPPLHITGLNVRHRPVHAAFSAPGPGRYELLAGNPQAVAPRYDLAALGSELAQLPIAKMRITPRSDASAYAQPDPFAGFVFEGASLDASPWTQRREVALSAAGVQQLELDPVVLAAARDDLGDLRLFQNGKQIPFIVERTSLLRSFPLTTHLDVDPRRPSLSRWKIDLPRPAAPVARLNVSSPTSLFQRDLRIVENVPGYHGDTTVLTLAASSWSRSPGSPPAAFSLPLHTRPRTSTLWLETDNGDNPPIAVEAVTAYFPVTRLVFRASDTQPLELLYGYADAPTPRYDLRLVAPQLLRAEKHVARLSETTTSPVESTSYLSRRAGIRTLFWIVLGLVVVLLLAIVARLLPKPPAAP